MERYCLRYWLNLDGEHIECPDEHWHFRPKVGPLGNHDIMADGYIRINVVDDIYYFGYLRSRPPTHTQMKAMKDYCIEHMLILTDANTNRILMID